MKAIDYTDIPGQSMRDIGPHVVAVTEPDEGIESISYSQAYREGLTTRKL